MNHQQVKILKTGSRGGGDNGNKLSTPNATSPNGGSDVETGSSEIIIDVKDGQTLRTSMKKLNK